MIDLKYLYHTNTPSKQTDPHWRSMKKQFELHLEVNMNISSFVFSRLGI